MFAFMAESINPPLAIEWSNGSWSCKVQIAVRSCNYKITGNCKMQSVLAAIMAS